MMVIVDVKTAGREKLCHAGDGWAVELNCDISAAIIFSFVVYEFLNISIDTVVKVVSVFLCLFQEYVWSGSKTLDSLDFSVVFVGITIISRETVNTTQKWVW